MREMAQYTRVPPAGRIDRLLKFNERLRTSADSNRHLIEWDLALDPQLVKIPARILPYPDVVFGEGRRYLCKTYPLLTFTELNFLRSS